MGLPAELGEAAEIDGAGPWRVFFSVYLPLATPGLAIVGILAFNYHWNEFFRPLIMTISEQNFTLPLGLVTLQGNLGTGSVSTVLAGVVISMIPASRLRLRTEAATRGPDRRCRKVTHPDPSFPTPARAAGPRLDQRSERARRHRRQVSRVLPVQPGRPVHERTSTGGTPARTTGPLAPGADRPGAAGGWAGRAGCWSGCLVDDNGTPTAVYTAVSAAGPVTAVWSSRRATDPPSSGRRADDPSSSTPTSRTTSRYAIRTCFRSAAAATPSKGAARRWRRLASCCTRVTTCATGRSSATSHPGRPRRGRLRRRGRVGVPEPVRDRREMGAPRFAVHVPWGRPSIGEVFALIGGLEPEGDGLRFRPETASRVDSGASFYAPQVLVDGERRLLWGWTRDLGRRPARSRQRDGRAR